jgi:hypothetical protein
MQLAFFGDETATFIVRSQVSAIPADQVTSVIYVFDIFDARGTLRHRVSGARSIPRSGPDGWALVDPNTVQLIADDVAGRMMQWLQQNPSLTRAASRAHQQIAHLRPKRCMDSRVPFR